MGLFDLFKKRNKANTVSEPRREEFASNISKKDMKVTELENGNLEIEYYDPNSKFEQFYNTTRLIVNRDAYTLGKSTVNDCLISWYNQDDAIMVGCESSREIYQRIVASLDIEKMMMMDEEYCTFVMSQLLEQKRVMDYLNRGKSDEIQKYPCGNYVGGVKRDGEGKLIKVFDAQAGKESHNSPYMQQIRSQERAKREQAKARRKAEIEAQIQSAQQELENL